MVLVRVGPELRAATKAILVARAGQMPFLFGPCELQTSPFPPQTLGTHSGELGVPLEGSSSPKISFAA